MDLKVIMVPFGGNEWETGALRTALELAKAHNAHVECWHVAPSPYDITTAFYSGQGLVPAYPEDIIFEVEKFGNITRDKALNEFSSIAAEMGVEPLDTKAPRNRPSASFHYETGDVGEILAARSRMCDLVIVSRATNEKNSFFKGIVDGILLDSARPVLLIPGGKAVNFTHAKVMIAWNNSLESARAVGFSFPFLEHSKAWVWNEKDTQDNTTDGHLLNYLRMHGAEAEDLFPETKTPESLLKSANAMGASLIVMGAYEHNRIRETVLGGMTDFMLKNANIPLLMAH
jgi:nucleotide-binding universal stress UspA family protein